MKELISSKYSVIFLITKCNCNETAAVSQLFGIWFLSLISQNIHKIKYCILRSKHLYHARGNSSLPLSIFSADAEGTEIVGDETSNFKIFHNRLLFSIEHQ